MRAATWAQAYMKKINADFNPRCPCGQRQIVGKTIPFCNRFQSTLPMRAATDNPDMLIGELKISIHAAHAGSDSPI